MSNKKDDILHYKMREISDDSSDKKYCGFPECTDPLFEDYPCCKKHLKRWVAMDISKRVRKIVFIYFIQEDDSGPIKIGKSKEDINIRLSALQVGNPRKLNLLAYFMADHWVEKGLHWLCSDHHIRGEWFEPHPDVIDIMKISQINQGNELLEILQKTYLKEIDPTQKLLALGIDF